MSIYTVIGIHKSTMQRDVVNVEASNPTEAQHIACNNIRSLGDTDFLIAGVIEGRVQLADEEENAEWPMLSESVDVTRRLTLLQNWRQSRAIKRKTMAMAEAEAAAEAAAGAKAVAYLRQVADRTSAILNRTDRPPTR